MTTATESFFAGLGDDRGADVLAKASGVVRFDLTRDDQVDSWTVRLDRGEVEAARGGGDAEPSCVVRCSHDLFEEIVRGRANVMAAVLRGEVSFAGDARLLLLLQRAFPRPPGSRHPRANLAGARGSS